MEAAGCRWATQEITSKSEEPTAASREERVLDAEEMRNLKENGVGSEISGQTKAAVKCCDPVGYKEGAGAAAWCGRQISGLIAPSTYHPKDQMSVNGWGSLARGGPSRLCTKNTATAQANRSPKGADSCMV